MKYFFTSLLLFLGGWFNLSGIFAQTQAEHILLSNTENLIPFGTQFDVQMFQGKESIHVTGPAGGSDVRFVKIRDLDFGNGTIELEVAGIPGPGANATARGFIGLAFRINDDNSAFECIYLRPTNGRAEDQLRRNHSVQYISYPDYPWQKLRSETPGLYESYADMVPGEWIQLRIEVKQERAWLYLHGDEQPVLIINDLKLGHESRGGIGLWIGPGTDGYFTGLKVRKDD
jgi:hypothetical protein